MKNVRGWLITTVLATLAVIVGGTGVASPAHADDTAWWETLYQGCAGASLEGCSDSISQGVARGNGIHCDTVGWTCYMYRNEVALTAQTALWQQLTPNSAESTEATAGYGDAVQSASAAYDQHKNDVPFIQSKFYELFYARTQLLLGLAQKWASGEQPPPTTPVDPGTPSDPSTPPATSKAFSKAYAPTIGGSTKVGRTLSAKVKTWSPKATGKAWQWRRNGTDIAGATKSTYKLTAADLGRTITVVLTGSKSGYTSTAKQSKATKKIALGTLARGKVKVTGTPKVGRTLTAKTSKWTTGVVYHYQWCRNSTALTGATAKTYILLATDSGKRFTVKVWTTKDGYKKSASRTSAKTGKVRA